MGGLPLPNVVKLIIAVLFDGVDFLLGMLPGIGEILDVAGIVLGFVLFGGKGLLHVWELIALGPLNILDAFVPTMTLIALWDIRGG